MCALARARVVARAPACAHLMALVRSSTALRITPTLAVGSQEKVAGE